MVQLVVVFSLGCAIMDVLVERLNRNYIMSIANIILNQLGGNRFLMFTGAKGLQKQERGLGMKLPARLAKGGINQVVITLNGNDLYDIKFQKVTTAEIHTKEVNDVYVEQLCAVFSEETGLALSL